MICASCTFASATLDDVDQLAALEIDLFRTDRCSKRSFRYLIRNAHVIVVKRVDTAEIVGYAILLSRKNSRKMRIYSFGIAETARGEGLAGKLIEMLENITLRENRATLTLEVNDSNDAAISLYKKHGFRQHGFRLGYYEDGGHAILMKKNINGSQREK